MNILYTITSYPPCIGGAQLYAHEIAKRVGREHKIEVVYFFDTDRHDWLSGTTLRTPEKEKSHNFEGVNVRQISFTRKEKLKMLPHVLTYYCNKKYNIGAIAKFIENKLVSFSDKPDLIHNIRVGREPLSYASYRVSRKLNIPFVFTPLHHPRWSHRFFKEYHELYRKADGLFALTPYEKEIYKGLGVSADRIFVTGTGPVLSERFNAQKFRNDFGISGKMVLFIGQGYKYKGIADLIKAAGVALKNMKDVSFIFIGPHTGYSKNLFKRIRNPNILHLGNVDLETKTSALAACDVFCLPSAQESFGAVYLEAWSFGKPVIGLDIPQLRCLVKDGINGYLVKPSPKHIAEKIVGLLDNPNLCARLGESGRMFTRQNFTWDILYRKTILAYEQVLNNKRDSI